MNGQLNQLAYRKNKEMEKKINRVRQQRGEECEQNERGRKKESPVSGAIHTLKSSQVAFR